jgi:hypothetical protein
LYVQQAAWCIFLGPSKPPAPESLSAVIKLSSADQFQPRPFSGNRPQHHATAQIPCLSLPFFLSFHSYSARCLILALVGFCFALPRPRSSVAAPTDPIWVLVVTFFWARQMLLFACAARRCHLIPVPNGSPYHHCFPSSAQFLSLAGL